MTDSVNGNPRWRCRKVRRSAYQDLAARACPHSRYPEARRAYCPHRPSRILHGTLLAACPVLDRHSGRIRCPRCPLCQTVNLLTDYCGSGLTPRLKILGLLHRSYRVLLSFPGPWPGRVPQFRRLDSVSDQYHERSMHLKETYRQWPRASL